MKVVSLGLSLTTLVALLIAIMGEDPAVADSACTGVDVRQGDDIAAVARSYSAGTTFCIPAGNYTVTQAIDVQSRDRFVGVYNDSVRPIVAGSGGVLTVFDTSGSDFATIKGLQVQDAVGHEACSPDCGRGIGSGGTNLRVDDVRATHNANQGIGGTGNGLLVTNSIVHNNGYDPTFTAETAGPVSAAGIKSINTIDVRNTVVRDNRWTGVWCDIDCGQLDVHDSTVVRNGKAGVHFEISSGPAVVEGSTIKGNGVLAEAKNHRRADLLIANSMNLDAYGNTFGGKGIYGFQAAFDEGRTEGFSLGNIRFHHNDLNGDRLSGCASSDSQVRCYKNRR